MAVNTVDSLGGPLSIEMVLDDSLFQQTIDDVVAGMAKVSKSATDIGARQQQVLETLVQNVLNSDSVKMEYEALKSLKDEWDRLNEAMKNTKDPNQIAVYAQELSQINGQINASIGQFEQTVQTQVVDSIKSVGEEFTQLFDASSQKTLTATQELRQLKNELAAGGGSNPEFDDLLDKAVELENRIKNVNKELELSSSNTAGLDALKQGVSGVVGGFEALSGILGFISTDNEEVRKSTEHVIAAMGVLNGIEEIGKVLSKESALNTYLLAQYRKLTATATEEQAVATAAVTTAMEGEAAATEAATAATEGLTVAMEANPAGILLLALTAIVVAIEAFAASSENATDKQTKMNTAIAEANELLAKLVDLQAEIVHQRTVDAERAVSLAQAQGKSENDIANLKLKALQASQQENYYKAASNGIDEKTLGIAEAELSIRLEELEALKRANVADEDRLKLKQAEVTTLQALVDKGKSYYESISSAQSQIDDLNAQTAKKAYDDALKSDAAAADARLILVKKNSQAELDAKIESINKQRVVDLDNANLTAGEIKKINAQADKDILDAENNFKILQLNNEKSLIQARINQAAAGSKEELDARLEMIQKNAEIEEAQVGVTAQKKKEIESAAAKATAEASEKYYTELQEAEVSTEIAAINTRLAAVQKGSDEELALKKQLVDKQAELDTLKVGQQIKNQELLTAKVKELHAKELADIKKMDDAAADHRLKSQLDAIDSQVAQQNAALDYAASNGSIQSKYNAQSEQLDNQFNALLKKYVLVNTNLIDGKGDVKNLQKELDITTAAIAQVRGQINGLDKNLKSELFSDAAQKLSGVGNAFTSLASTIGDANSQLADIIETAGDFANVTSQIAKGLADLSEQNYVGAAVGAIGAVTSIFQIFAKEREKEQAQQKQAQDFQNAIFEGEIAINELYRQRQLEQVTINKLRMQGLADEQALLRDQAKQIQSDYQTVFDALQKESYQQLHTVRNGLGIPHQELENVALLGKTYEQIEDLYLKGQLTDSAAKLFETLQKLKEEGADVQTALQQAAQEAKEALTGTTADSITDSIIQGFADGKRAVADFADDFQSLMKQAILNTLKYQALEAPLKDFYDQFAADTQSDGGLSEEEIKQLQDFYNNIIENAGKQFDQLKALTGVDFNSNADNSLAGSIKASLTEETGSIIAGQFSAMRIDVRSMLDLATRSLSHLSNIESNTALLADIQADINFLKIQGIKIKA